jgi:hypothetical protein
MSDPPSMTVEEGAFASLACQFHAMAHPVTMVLWKKNGKLIIEDGSRIKMNKSNGTLVISEVELDDHGNYSCMVNTTGFKPVHSKPASVMVKGRIYFCGKKTQVVFHISICLACQKETNCLKQMFSRE